MTQLAAVHPQWNRYRALVDETSELEYKIIGILSNALCRKDGDGQPNAGELSEIKELKAILHPKLKELHQLHTEVTEFLQKEKALGARHLLK